VSIGFEVMVRFKSGNFDLKNKEHSNHPKKFKDVKLRRLLDENSAQMLEELAEALNVDKLMFLVVYNDRCNGKDSKRRQISST